MIYLRLFWSFLQVGLFCIGGGYAALPQIQNQVTVNGWLTLNEFTDIISISEMTPGPIAINAATFVGTRVAGLPGAFVATLGCVFPSCIIVLTLAFFYKKYGNLKAVQEVLRNMRPAVVAMIASAGLGILLLALFGGSLPHSLADMNWLYLGIFAAGVAVLRIFKLNPIWIIAGSGILGIALYLLGIL